MKRYIMKTVSLLLSLILLLGVAQVTLGAIEFTKGANSVSDSYKAEKYYEYLTRVPHTGDGRTDVLAVALSQLGYTEGNSDGAFSGTVAGGTANYTEYNYNMGSFGSGYGGSAYPWCASFVSFCLLQAGCHDQTSTSDWCRKHEGDAKYIWREVSCQKWAAQLRTCGYFENSVAYGGDYEPIAGDLIFFTSGGTTETHIGLVLYCDGQTVYTVEGNTSSAAGLETNGGGVYAKSYSLSSSYIRGYGILPYEVNNFVDRIDYSGAEASTGLYVSTISKYVYPTPDASTYNRVLPKYSLFAVTEIADNNRLKIVYTVNGAAVEGYVKNNSDRVIQLSSDTKPDGYCKLSRAFGFKGGEIEGYTVDALQSEAKPSVAQIALGGCVGICGYAGFTREIEAFGYYFDDLCQSVVWQEDASVSTDADITSLGTKHAQGYKIEAKSSSLNCGAHTAHFVVKLCDGTVCEIDSVSFIAREKNNVTPKAPSILSVSDGTVTLVPTEGYEYSLGDGAWQSSNVFSGLEVKEGVEYSFCQRIAQTETQLASDSSESVLVDLGEVIKKSKLVSLSLEGVELSPKFDPDVLSYEARVPFGAEGINVIAEGHEGAAVSISDFTLEAGKTAEIKIEVSADLCDKRIYTLKVFCAEMGADSETTAEQTEALPEESGEESADILSESTSDNVTSDTENKSEESASCSSAIGIGSVLTALLTGALCVRKKEDDQ